MSFKLNTTNHDSTSCPGATFRIFRKTYGRKIDLDMRLAEYNQSMRDLGDKRQMLMESARLKAMEIIGGKTPKKVESVIQISQETGADGAAVQKADMTGVSEPQNSPRFQYEMVRNLDLRGIADLDEKATALRLTRLRPIYMDVYLHSVSDMEMEDGTPLHYMSSMSAADKERFYKEAPGELIDEVFTVLSDKISMTDEERANFGLPTTGSPAAVVGPTTSGDGTAKNASEENSGSAASAGSQK